MSRFCAFIVILLMVLSSVAAQGQPPEYRIYIIRGVVTQDGRNLEIEFGISNIGGSASEDATVELRALNPSGSQVVESKTVRPLSGNNDREFFTFLVPVTSFPPGQQQQFQVTLADSTIRSNPAIFSIGIPVYQVPSNPLERLFPQIDFQDRQQVMLVMAIVAVLTIILWLLTVLLRQIFKRPPQFGSWQPPYATLPPLDSNSTYGRRQLWQQHAQNNIITTACSPGALHGTKMLVGADQKYLSGWHITSIRMSQYDMYGRVSRSVVIAPYNVVRKLDRAAQRSGTVERSKLHRQMRPLANKLAKLILKRITPRSAMLPIAFDVRFQGVHGEVGIVFNVYQCVNGYWQQIEGWHPDMMVMSRNIYESYTYTLFGQTGGETLKDFRRRLPDDITHVLTELIGPRPFMPEVVPQQREAPPTNPGMVRVDIDTQKQV